MKLVEIPWSGKVHSCGSAGHSHKSDLDIARSMQTDVWKCLLTLTLDNPEHVSSSFSRSVAKSEPQWIMTLSMQKRL